MAHRYNYRAKQASTVVCLLCYLEYGTSCGYASGGALAHVFLCVMIGGWQLLKNVTTGAMYGKVRDGFQTEEKSIIVTVVAIILEHNNSPSI